MDLTSANWLDRLNSSGAIRDGALAELRSLLVRRVRHAFRTRVEVDDSFVDDCAQDAVMTILDSLDQFAGRSQFTTWATTIAIRKALAELRRRRWQDVSLDQLLSDGQPEVADRHADRHELVLEGRQLIQDMYRLINTELTARQRDALLAELNGMPQEEIGRRLGTNRNAVYKLTHDARKRLKKCLEQAGYTPADLKTLPGPAA